MAISGFDPDKKIKLFIPPQAEEQTDYPLLVNLTVDNRPTSVDDDFTGTDGSAPDPLLWDTLFYDPVFDNQASGTGTIQSNKLNFSVDTANSCPITPSLFTLDADFDLRVDFTLPSLPSPDSDWAIGVSVQDSKSQLLTGNYALMSRYYTAVGPYRSGITGESDYLGGSADLSGTFRIVRIGSTCTTYYKSGSSWIQANSSSSFTTNPLYVLLFDRTWSTKEVTVNFDNFQIVWPDTILQGSGVTNSDQSAIFTELGVNSKKIAVEEQTTGNQCFVEIENWDSVNKSAQLHVKVPTLSATEHTILNLYYDSTHADNTDYIGDTGDVLSESVWSSIYKFVSHQAQDPTGAVLDSTTYAKNGISYGTMTSEDLIDGSTGKMIEYDGIDDYTNHGYDAAHDITDVLTIRAVIRPSITLDVTSVGVPGVGIVSRQYDPTDTEDTYGLFINDNGCLQFGSQGGYTQSTKSSWGINETFVVHATYNSTGFLGDLFVNGIKETLITDTLDAMAGSVNNLVIAKQGDTGAFFPGAIDEVTIINVVVSDDWVALDALAIRDNLITFSIEETLPGWDSDKRFKITIPYQANPLIDFPVLLNLGVSSGTDNLDTSAVIDEFVLDSYTKLLISSDTTDGSTDFVDSSASGHIITVNGNTRHETDQAKFGDTSIYFTLNTDDLQLPVSGTDDFYFPGDFTIDLWLIDSSTVNSSIYALEGPSSTWFALNYNGSSNEFNIFLNASSVAVSYSGFSLFEHVALVRYEDTVSLYVKGVLIWSTVNSNPLGFIGTDIVDNRCSGGARYIDEFRISKGIARWTDDFTPPITSYASNKRIAVCTEDLQQLPVEIENWEADKAQLWTKVPEINGPTDDTILYLYYDKDQEDNTDYIGDTGDSIAQSVWPSNYKFLSHQAQDPSGTAPQILDSTSYAKHGTSYGTMTSDDLVDGSTGKMIEYDGIDDYTNHGYDVAHDITDVLTIRAVIRPSITLDSGVTNYIGIVSRAFNPSTTDTYYIAINPDGKLHLSTNGGNIQSTKASWASGETFVIHATYNATGLVGDLFVDGLKEILTSDALDAMAGSSNNLIIGTNEASGDLFPGAIDEVAIIHAVMSDDWAALDNLVIRDNLVTFSIPFIGYEFKALNSFLLSYADVLTANSRVLELYHISAIPTINVQQYHLVNEKDVYTPEGYNYKVRLKVDADKITSIQNGFMALVYLDHEHLFDTVKSPTPAALTVRTNNVWLSPTGSDTVGNGSEESPWKTVYHAVWNCIDGSNIILKPGRYIETLGTGYIDRQVHITSSTGDYRDVIIQTPNTDQWFKSGADGSGSSFRYVTIESYNIQDTFYQPAGAIYFYNIFYVYKGTEAGHDLCNGTQISHGIMFIYNCTVLLGVGSWGYYTEYGPYNTIIDKAVNVLWGVVAHHCCIPGLAEGTSYNNLDYDLHPPEFVTADSATIPYLSPCRDTGSDTYRNWYDGDAPDIGCHEIGDPYSRLLFVDVSGNPLIAEFNVWDDVTDKALFYLHLNIDSEEDTEVYLYYKDAPTDLTSTFYAPSSEDFVALHTKNSYSNFHRYNVRQVIPASAISKGGPSLRLIIHFDHAGTDWNLESCFIGHKGVGDVDFDGSQVQVTFNGGSTSASMTTDGYLTTDLILYDLDSDKPLVLTYYSSASLAAHPINDGLSIRLWYDELDGSVDESGVTSPTGTWVTYANYAAGIYEILVPPEVSDYWSDYKIVAHGMLDDGFGENSALSDYLITSPVFTEDYVIDTPFGPGFNLAYSVTAHLITDDAFDITAGTIVVVLNTSNTSVSQVLFSTPASATTNQHKFEITTSGAIQITDAGGTASVSTETGFNDGEYHTVVFSWDGTGRKVEVDKTDLTLSNPTATFITAPFSTEGLIGYDYVLKDSAGDSFDGIIGEFRLSKSALNTDLIRTISYSETDTLFDTTISSHIAVDETYGAGSLTTFETLGWVIAKGIPEYSDVTVYEEPWVIMQPPNLQVFEEYWGLKLLTTMTELYGDIALKKNIFVEWYDDGANPKNTFIEKYNDAERRKAVYSLLWLINANPTAFVNENYAITETVVTNVIEELYEIKEQNKVQALKELPYHLLSEETTSSTPEAFVTIDGTQIDFSSLSVEAGMAQYHISGSFTPSNASEYAKCAYLKEVIATIGGTDFNMFIESRTKQGSVDGMTYNIGILSQTTKLDVPYADTIVDNLDSGVMAKTLVEQMAAIENITVDYQVFDWDDKVLDWFIPGYAISINDETPMAVIKKVVNSIGAIIQTKPNGDMLIISQYPVSPPSWDNEEEVKVIEATYSVESAIVSLTESSDIRAGSNAFLITDQGSSSESINLEEENINSTTKIVKGFRVPFDDGPFGLETSGGSQVTIDPHIYPITEARPLVESDGDDEWEIIEFIDHTGSTSYPIYGVIAIDWVEEDLGALTISEDGTLTVTDPSNVSGESLLRIKYYTKYWKWTVTGPDTHPVQVYVPEIEEGE